MKDFSEFKVGDVMVASAEYKKHLMRNIRRVVTGFTPNGNLIIEVGGKEFILNSPEMWAVEK